MSEKEKSIHRGIRFPVQLYNAIQSEVGRGTFSDFIREACFDKINQINSNDDLTIDSLGKLLNRTRSVENQLDVIFSFMLASNKMFFGYHPEVPYEKKGELLSLALSRSDKFVKAFSDDLKDQTSSFFELYGDLSGTDFRK